MEIEVTVNEILGENFEEEFRKQIEKHNRIDSFLDECSLCSYKSFNKDLKKKETYWIIWIDILGFKNLIEKGDDEDFIFKLISFISNFSQTDPFIEKSFLFSDTIVMLSKLGSHDLVFLLESLAILQLQVIQIFNQPIRGSLTIGEVSTFTELRGTYNSLISNNYIFGKGIIRAYELENKVSYPLIAVDPDLINLSFELAKKYPDKYPEEVEEGKYTLLFPHGQSNFSFIKKFLVKMIRPLPVKIDQKCLYFIDYLSQLSSLVDTQKEYIDFLRLHKEFIENNLIFYNNSPRIREKYKWLADYHNSFFY